MTKRHIRSHSRAVEPEFPRLAATQVGNIAPMTNQSHALVRSTVREQIGNPSGELTVNHTSFLETDVVIPNTVHSTINKVVDEQCVSPVVIRFAICFWRMG